MGLLLVQNNSLCPPQSQISPVCSLRCSEVLQVKGVQIASYRSGEILRHENQNWQCLCASVQGTLQLHGLWQWFNSSSCRYKGQTSWKRSCSPGEEVSHTQNSDRFNCRGSNLWITPGTFIGLSANGIVWAAKVNIFLFSSCSGKTQVSFWKVSCKLYICKHGRPVSHNQWHCHISPKTGTGTLYLFLSQLSCPSTEIIERIISVFRSNSGDAQLILDVLVKNNGFTQIDMKTEFRFPSPLCRLTFTSCLCSGTFCGCSAKS